MERQSLLELLGRVAALAAVGAMRLEVRPLGGVELSVVEPRQELREARGMRRPVFRHGPIFPESMSGTRSAFNCALPRAILDLTVPTGNPRETAISS